MDDQLIRRHLHQRILSLLHHPAGSLVVNELGLMHGRCRADVAVVGDELTGFEIKGETDTLTRLDKQVATYSYIFDLANVVTVEKHSKSVAAKLPQWWGLILCKQDSSGELHFETAREGKRNLGVCPYSLASLLWKEEVIAMLIEHGELGNLRRCTRKTLYSLLVQSYAAEQLRSRVCMSLMKRNNWRDPELQFRCDGLSQPLAKW